ncbi:MAG: DUF3830 family protein [Betaproteobacteria bacterium]|nr:DUF3830 family protein [Betaproteobacteria bacterium]NDC71788.1 DUF3830 family protein [Betaproteobacteria bacterium]
MANLLIKAGGYQFGAEFHPDAPKTVEAFKKLLPYRQKVIHVRWSGEGPRLRCFLGRCFSY